jgi:hypothetical protein
MIKLGILEHLDNIVDVYRFICELMIELIIDEVSAKMIQFCSLDTYHKNDILTKLYIVYYTKVPLLGILQQRKIRMVTYTKEYESYARYIDYIHLVRGLRKIPFQYIRDNQDIYALLGYNIEIVYKEYHGDGPLQDDIDKDPYYGPDL